MGIGKTYAISRVIDWVDSCLSKSDYDEAFAYFYCIKQDEMSCNPTGILRSIVKQIAMGPRSRYHENLAVDDTVSKLWKQDCLGRFHDTFDDWKDCLFKLLEKYPRAIIVLDALDECKPADWKYLVELFTTLVSRLTKGNTVKIFVLMREEIDLLWWLSKYSVILMHKGRTAVDIAAFV